MPNERPNYMSFNRWTTLLIAALGISCFARFVMDYRQDEKAVMAFGAGFLVFLLAALVVGAIAALIARRSSRVFNIAASAVLLVGFGLIWYFPIKHALFPEPPKPLPDLRHTPPPAPQMPRK